MERAGIKMNEEFKCPTCSGYIPNNENIGAYAGAISRKDNKTEICSACGTREAMEEFSEHLDKVAGIAWQSTVTEQMIAHLDENEISLLINALNDAVAEICESYEIE
jgi:Na+-translocating ferredoxin:NAD+ oxidoreductase RNF subunit RnfB